MKVGLTGLAGRTDYDEESVFWYFAEEITERAEKLRTFAKATGDKVLAELVTVAHSVASGEEEEELNVGLPGLASYINWNVPALFPYFVAEIAERAEKLRMLAKATADGVLAEVVHVALTIALDNAKSKMRDAESELDVVKDGLREAMQGLQAQLDRIAPAVHEAVPA
jgi:hypothetical protein